MAGPRLPRDTPVDTPAVEAGGALIEAPELGPDAASIGARVLARARSVETLEVAFAAWGELRDAHRAAQRRWKDERERLTQQGSLLLGAVRAAAGGPVTPETDSGLSERSRGLDGFLSEAKGKLDVAQRDLEERIAAEEQAFQSALQQLRSELRDRVARAATALKPDFKLAVRVLPGDRRILHAHRLGQDEAVVALWALTQRIPTRYDFLSDDSTDDLNAAPPVLYADEGVTDVRPTAGTLGTLLLARPDVWPVKGMLPLLFPGDGWMRWTSRGAVLEAEVREGDGFRSVLTAEEAERATGLLLAHKLAGRIQLELVRD